jgi:plastocyanin
MAVAVCAALSIFSPMCVESACPSCGKVSGTITVEQAFIRTDGVKHDRDVVVMLEPIGTEAPAKPGARAAMDQQGLVFEPHVLAVPRGATVTFLNSDKEQHNVYFLDDRTGDTLDIGTWGPGISVDHTFDTPGMVITLCKLHLEMAAYVVVCPSPWFAQVKLESTDKPGRFEIANVPAGEYELTAWHKKLRQKGGAVRIDVRAEFSTEVNIVITKPKFARASR